MGKPVSRPTRCVTNGTISDKSGGTRAILALIPLYYNTFYNLIQLEDPNYHHAYKHLYTELITNKRFNIIPMSQTQVGRADCVLKANNRNVPDTKCPFLK